MSSINKWRLDDSAELYNINGWGLKYFSINEQGHMTVTPKQSCVSVDLVAVMEELAAAVEKLPPDLQNIIVLAYYERMPLVEITKWVHYSYRTVKLKHKKALELLRESLEKE